MIEKLLIIEEALYRNIARRKGAKG